MNKPCRICPYEECSKSCFVYGCTKCYKFSSCKLIEKLYSFFIPSTNQFSLEMFVDRKRFKKIRDKIIKCRNKKRWLDQYYLSGKIGDS